jgi:hypothetical protein
MLLGRQEMSMENNLPLNFIVPEIDLQYRLMRLLILIDTHSFSSKGNPVLTIEKISFFDFLIKYPNILKEVLRVKNKDIKILSREKGSIETLYPNRLSLFNFSSTRILLNLLLAYNFVEIEIINSQICYIISKSGKEFITDLDNEEINRIQELNNYLLPLRSTKDSELKNLINPLVKGV